MRESVIERYLHKRVVAAGGFTYKFKSPGRRNVPDRIVILGDRVHFVECKAPGKKPRAGQAREFKRLDDLGCLVRVLDTKAKVDGFVSWFT